MKLPIVAVIPVKAAECAKQRLSSALPAPLRRDFALAMLEDVMAAVAKVEQLAGMLVVTEDSSAIRIAQRHGARVETCSAKDGHTGAVMKAAHTLAADGFGMLALPGDIPLVTPDDIVTVLREHDRSDGFTIVPAHDFHGSNAIVCTPADAVPLCYGPDSYYPHIEAARRQGLTPRTIEVPNIALDIDTADDLANFFDRAGDSHALHLLKEWQGALQI